MSSSRDHFLPNDEALAHDPERVFYEDGFAEGRRDGVAGGKAEGRSMGLKTGFDKFVEAGKIAGRATVWAKQQALHEEQQSPASLQASSPKALDMPGLEPLPGGARLARNIELVYALVEPATLSTENKDEAVDDFDDRLKRAQGKMTVILRGLGEKEGDGNAKPAGGLNM